MFTGIVEATGKVVTLQPHADGLRLAVDVSSLGDAPRLGASVAVNGACLTVAQSDGAIAHFDVVGETCRRTNLALLSVDQRVNLELPLRVGQTIDGHFVQGHIDGTATVERIEQEQGQWTVWFRADQPKLISPYLVSKGSIAVDGVSLTLVDVEHQPFSVALIPTTLDRTTLRDLNTGDRVNIETDLLARIVVRQLKNLPQPGETLTIQSLKQAGFT